jgi:hypothetical protein
VPASLLRCREKHKCRFLHKELAGFGRRSSRCSFNHDEERGINTVLPAADEAAAAVGDNEKKGPGEEEEPARHSHHKRSRSRSRR